MQEAFLALIQQEEQIYNYEAWLMLVVKRQCLMYLRRKRRQLTDSVDSAILEAIAQTVSNDIERRVLLRDLDEAIGHLPQRCQSILRARYFDGLETRDIAEALGYRNSSIRKICSRCIVKLVRHLDVSSVGVERSAL